MSPSPNRPRAKQRSLLSLLSRRMPLLLSALLLAGCSQPPQVELGKVVRRTILEQVSVSGIIEPVNEVPIASDVSGEVIAVNVEEGERVEKGELLFIIRPDNFEAALQQAQASLNSAKADYASAQSSLTQAESQLLQDSIEFQRAETLFQDSAIPQQQFQQARTTFQRSKAAVESAEQAKQAAFYRIENAKASVRQAKNDLDRTKVFASMDGTVTMMDAKVGQRVVGTGMMAGTDVVKIADLSQMKVEVEVNENDIVRIAHGDTVDIEVDAYPDKVFKGRVIKVGYSPVGSSASQSASEVLSTSSDQVTNYPVTVRINPASYRNDTSIMAGVDANNSPFRPGMSGVVTIYTDRAADALAVPIQAVSVNKQQANAQKERRVVYGLSPENKVTAHEVSTGISDDRYIEVQSGLEEDQEIITGPYKLVSRELRDGMEVQPAPAMEKQANGEPSGEDQPDEDEEEDDEDEQDAES